MGSLCASPEEPNKAGNLPLENGNDAKDKDRIKTEDQLVVVKAEPTKPEETEKPVEQKEKKPKKKVAKKKEETAKDSSVLETQTQNKQGDVSVSVTESKREDKKDISVTESKKEDKKEETKAAPKKKKKNEEVDLNEFTNNLLEEINLFRSDPTAYSVKILSHSKYIKKKDDKIIYDNADIKQVLTKGEESFKFCVELIKSKSKMTPLQLTNEIRIEVPDEVEKQVTGHGALLKELKAANPKKTVESNLDINELNHEAIVVLQLVDDTKTNGKRRGNLINESFKNLGVSVKKNKKAYAIYLTFSNWFYLFLK